MKRTFHFLLLMFCINTSASAQNYYDVSECRSHLPRLKPTDIVNFPKKDSNAFVTSCTLDTVSKTLYYYHCYGGLFCSMSISKPDMHAILAKKITPFEYYDLVISFDVNIIEKVKNNLEANGSNAKFTSFEKQNLQIDDSVKFPSTLTKLLELDEQLVNLEVQVTKFHSVQPKYIKRDRSYYNTLGEEYGKMEIWRLSDSVVTFYNHLDAQPVYKAMLDLKKSALYFYNRSDELIDKIEINKNKIALLINEKFDVFALYRMWLEWKRQSIAEAIEETKKEGRVAEKKQYALNVLSEQSKMLYALDYKIEYFTNADKQYVLQKLRRQFGAIFAPSDPQETGRMIYQTTGDKEYELTDHRGNVMVRISDNKIGIPRKDDPTLVDHYEAQVVGATDYTPFGSAMQGRSVNSDKYPYGYNGKENDNETGDQNYGMRIYDPRVARFLSVDPLTKKYPELTPYQFASNSPIMGIDLDGQELFIVHGTNQGNTPLIENNKGVVFGNDEKSRMGITNQFLRITGNSVSDNNFRWHAPLWNNEKDRTLAAVQLVSYIISTRKYLLENKLINENEPVSLLGYSHGGNVAIQASNFLNNLFGIKVNLVTLSTPAYRSGFIFKDPEDPRESSGINYHVHISHQNDAVWFFATGLPSYPAPTDNYYIQESEIPLRGGIESHTELPSRAELGKYLGKIPTMPVGQKPIVLDKYIQQIQQKEKQNTQSTNTQTSP
jgi:RHS repeat-associated protein